MNGKNIISQTKSLEKQIANGGYTCNNQIHKIQENSASEQNPNIQQDVDRAGIVACMSALTTYDQLVQYVNNNPLPEFTDEPNDAIAQEEIHNLDIKALHHIPHDAPHRVAPISVEGDGNCFPRIVSYLLYKTERRYMEIHVIIVYEAIKNLQSYLDHNYISVGAVNFYDCGTLPEQYAMYSDNYIPNTGIPVDMLDLYRQEVKDICKDEAYMGIWQIFQAANVLKCPI